MAEAVPDYVFKEVTTEEEKKAKADRAALVVEESRKKAIRDRRIAIKQLVIDEEKRSKLSKLQLHKTWRSIMREQSVLELRGDIKWIAQKHVHEVENKDRHIRTLCKTLKESENQHQEAMSRHFIIMDNMIDVHDVRIQQMETSFQEQLQNLNHSFFGERDLMTQDHDKLKKDLATMVNSMKEYFDEEIHEKRQEFEAHLEEVKNKNKEEYNVLKILNEEKIEQMERDIDKTHQDYIENTKEKEEKFKILTEKDKMTSRVIDHQMRELVTFHNKTQYMKKALIVKSKEWNETNKRIYEENGRLNWHFLTLKRNLSKVQNVEHDNLKKTSTSAYEATKALKRKLDFVWKLQTLARLNKKLETEHEQIFPFNPLYVASVPTAPLDFLDEEMVTAAEDEKCYMLRNQPKCLWEVPHDVFPGEPIPGQVAPKQGKRFRVDMRISFPTDGPHEAPPIAKAAPFHWSSHATDDNGNEVAELDYLQNFQKRYNKVMLDKLALQLERSKLIAENRKLQESLGKWLDGYTFSEEV